MDTFLDLQVTRLIFGENISNLDAYSIPHEEFVKNSNEKQAIKYKFMKRD